MTEDTILTTEMQALQKAGASGYFIVVFGQDPEDLGVSKNYARQKLLRAWDTDDVSAMAVTAAKTADRSGDFFSALWSGHLARALYHADATNLRILLRVFSEEILVAELAADRGSVESAQRWYDDYDSRYGWPEERDSE